MTTRIHYALLAALALGLAQPLTAAAQQVPMGADQGEAEHVATEETRLLQLLQIMERASEALEQGAEGQGENALHNARNVLEELRQDSDHPWLEPTMQEVADVQAAIAEGNMTWAETRLAFITETLENELEREDLDRVE